nr:peptide ABC transporter substrate-binding protein [uncultured Acidocella sp.]
MNFRAFLFGCMLVFQAVPFSARAIQNDCHTIVIPPGLGIGPGADVTSFNPLFVTSLYNQEAIWMMFEQLVWVNRNHDIDWTRSLASSISIGDNGKTFDITLRPWVWSDGVPVTSADILYTYKLIQSYGQNYSGYGGGGVPMLIQSMTAPDAEHVRIVLKHAVNPQWFILNGISQFTPLPQHIWGKYTTNQIWDEQSNPAFFSVVDGPLKIRKLAIGQYAEFVPNPLYPGAKMHFERFFMKFQNNEGEELQAVQSDDIDMGNVPFDLYSKAAGMPGTRLVTMPPSYSWNELVPNLLNKSTGFFKDIRIRQALADAINQKEIIRIAFHGHGIETYNPVPPVPANFLSPSAKQGDYPVGYNPQKARMLLKAAGFTPGKDGILQKDGQRLEFTLEIPAGQDLRIEIAELIQQDLKAVGIDMKVQQVEFNELLTAMVSMPQSWQAILIAEDLSPYPSGEYLFKTGGYYNNNGYSDKTMDQLIDESTNLPGMQALFAYQDYASAQQPVIFLPEEEYSVLARENVHGVRDFMNPLGMWAPEKLFCTAH